MTIDNSTSLPSGLQSGQLLHSIKSRCGCCGKETIDPDEVPDDLNHQGIQVTSPTCVGSNKTRSNSFNHGTLRDLYRIQQINESIVGICSLQIPPSEYQEAISHLMLDHKFRCHVWCYNTPAAIAFFFVFLCLCLSIIPLIEVHFIYKGRTETGLEFVHGGVVWLCGLTIYMVIIHISKRKVEKKMLLIPWSWGQIFEMFSWHITMFSLALHLFSHRWVRFYWGFASECCKHKVPSDWLIRVQSMFNCQYLMGML